MVLQYERWNEFGWSAGKRRSFPQYKSWISWALSFFSGRQQVNGVVMASREKTTTTDHSCNIMRVMNNQRKRGLLCDVTLVVQGKHFPAHRGVLAATSDFFHLMFTMMWCLIVLDRKVGAVTFTIFVAFCARMNESMSSEVELRGTEPEIMEMLMDFIYTGQISVDGSNVEALVHAANQYLLDPVKKICVKFLKGQIDETNCLGILVLAENICPELKDKVENYLQNHFRKVAKLDEFQQLDVTQLTRLLRQDKLMSAEEQIYNAALRWLKHDLSNRRQYLVEVLSCVRFPLISKGFLSKIVQAEPLIQNNAQCLSMVMGGMSYHLVNPEDRVEINQRQCKKWPPQITLFYYSLTHSSFDFKTKDFSWMCIPFTLKTLQNAAAVYWDKNVYFLGGSYTTIPERGLSCYNIQQDSWLLKSGLPLPRINLAACVTQGIIYTSGGTTERGDILKCFECYNTETNSWEAEPSMLTPRCCHSSVAVNGLIYVCGGTGFGRVFLNSCEVYDPITREWSQLSSMKEARKNHSLVAVRNRIYAIGGQGLRGKLSSVEYYDIDANEWCPAMSMPWVGLKVKCAAVGEVIYVLTGKGLGTKQFKNILEYHTKTDSWVVNVTVQVFPFRDCLICAVAT